MQSKQNPRHLSDHNRNCQEYLLYTTDHTPVPVKRGYNGRNWKFKAFTSDILATPTLIYWVVRVMSLECNPWPSLFSFFVLYSPLPAIFVDYDVKCLSVFCFASVQDF